jgi:major intracellular serine protease
MSDTVYKLPDVLVGTRRATETGLTWYHALVQYEKVAELTNSGEGARVAILDDAGKVTNTNLIGQIEKVYEFTNEDFQSGFHGAHVSGIVASKKHGVFPKLKLGLFKVLTAEDGIGMGAWVKEGIKAARLEGYEVINASLGSDQNDHRIESEVTLFVSNSKRFFVCASGNDGAATDYPAALSKTLAGVISVGAVEYKRNEYKIATFSSAGAVTIVAFGVDILSTTATEGEAYLSGTSMATPFISGLIAACKVIYPEFDHNTFEFVAKTTSKSIDEGIYRDGYGVVQMPDFIQCVKDIAAGTIVMPKEYLTNTKVAQIKRHGILTWLKSLFGI